VERVALDAKADLPERQAALQTLIDNHAPDLRTICEKLLSVRFSIPLPRAGWPLSTTLQSVSSSPWPTGNSIKVSADNFWRHWCHARASPGRCSTPWRPGRFRAPI